ncbi:transcription factor tcp14, partial [Phtheirospermum japonicum]
DPRPPLLGGRRPDLKQRPPHQGQRPRPAASRCRPLRRPGLLANLGAGPPLQWRDHRVAPTPRRAFNNRRHGDRHHPR